MLSVIIPSYNRKDELERAIRSVLTQSYFPVEIIVVDDGSTDGTGEFIRVKYPEVKFIRNETSKGGAVARNQGALASQAEHIAFLDSDDEWLPKHIENSVTLIMRENCEGCYSSFFLKEESQTPQKIIFNAAGLRKGNIGDLILGKQRFDARTSTFVFRREAFLKIRFDEQLRKHQDWDLAINFDQNFTFVFNPEAGVVLHIKKSGRMSSSLNYDATQYFLEKNKRFILPDNVFIFCLKMIWRIKRSEDKQLYNKFIQIISALTSTMSFKNVLLFKLIKSNVLNIELLYRLRKLVK